MKIENIEVADITLKDTIRKESEIQFVFPKIYIVDQNKYIENCSLIIKDWSKIELVTIIAESSTIFKKIFLGLNQFEKFDLIQEISKVKENTLIIKGYSRDSDNWLEYSFINCNYEILQVNGVRLVGE